MFCSVACKQHYNHYAGILELSVPMLTSVIVLLRGVAVHYSQVAKADAAQLKWRGDAGDSAVPVFIAERLAFASGAGRVKVSTSTSTH
jgi:hypothetical protein